jgi:2-keto-4-pentenoate hydratase
VLQPKAEAEIALVLGNDVMDPGATAETIAAATDRALAAIEIVDSRITDWKITFADTVADNGSSAFYVLGDAKPLDGLDLYSCGNPVKIPGLGSFEGIKSSVFLIRGLLEIDADTAGIAFCNLHICLFS